MLRPRFSLKSLLGVMTFLGFALASLTQPLQSWYPSLVLTGTLALLLLSVSAGIYARGQTRAFYVGFAIAGWGYFFVAYPPWFEATIAPQLLAYPIAESVCIAVTGSLGDSQYYLRVCHALSMFILAYFGGLAADRCYLLSVAQASAAGCDSNYLSDSDDHLHVPSRGLPLRKVQ